jgi:putative flippase GtrA
MKIRYFVAGVLNTTFGYLAGVGFYKLLHPDVHILLIGLIVNIFTISFSFFTYKFYVFNTTSNWLFEYFKSYIMYGLSSLIGVVLLWLILSVLGFSIWLAQALVMMVMALFSYVGNLKFVFRKHKWD